MCSILEPPFIEEEIVETLYIYIYKIKKGLTITGDEY